MAAADTRRDICEVRHREATIEGLRRIGGQVKGIQRMMEEGRPCEEVMAELMSARAALDKVALSVIVELMEECLVETESSTATRSTIQRALTLFLRMSPGIQTTVSQ